MRDEMRRERDEARQALLAAVREAGELHERAERAEGVLRDIDRLWHEYRDAEHAAWVTYTLGGVPVSWDEYRAMFKRFPNFPDWLKAALAADQPAEEGSERG